MVAVSSKFANLSSRVAIITGASRGIGRECALTLARAGCNIVVAAKSTVSTPNLPGSIYTVAEEVEALGVKALPVLCDVRNDEHLKNLVSKTMETFGQVNNAGALWWKPVVETPMERYDLINGINSRATFMLASLVLPHMLKQNRGNIINMSPPIDTRLLVNKTAYCISKFGMTLTAMGIGQETQGTGVTAHALWPATMVWHGKVESFATINHKLGDEKMWRKASILADTCHGIVSQHADVRRGEALIDEDFLREMGVEDFTKYRCDPNVEPPRMIELDKKFYTGVGRAKDRAKL